MKLPIEIMLFRSYNRCWAILLSIHKWHSLGYEDNQYDGTIDMYSFGFFTITYTTCPYLVYTEEECERHRKAWYEKEALRKKEEDGRSN